MNQIITPGVKSWQTTILGAIVALSLLLDQVKFLIDNDPATSLDLQVVIAALGALGLGWFARDNDKTSERVGAR